MVCWDILWHRGACCRFDRIRLAFEEETYCQVAETEFLPDQCSGKM